MTFSGLQTCCQLSDLSGNLPATASFWAVNLNLSDYSSCCNSSGIRNLHIICSGWLQADWFCILLWSELQLNPNLSFRRPLSWFPALNVWARRKSISSHSCGVDCFLHFLNNWLNLGPFNLLKIYVFQKVKHPLSKVCFLPYVMVHFYASTDGEIDSSASDYWMSVWGILTLHRCMVL